MYDRVSDLQLEGGKRLAERLGVKAGARVLDVGCGTGRLAQWLVMQRSRTHASGEAVVDLLEASSFGNLLRPVPEELQMSLRADFVAALNARRGPDGIVVRGWGVLAIAAR